MAGVASSLSVLLTLCHWQRLKKPHLALLKVLLIIATVFGLGTLPWQQNFTGLIAGFLTGFCITLALVPFVNLTKYNRKSKVSHSQRFAYWSEYSQLTILPLQINLIWSCIVSHVLITAAMFLVFYLFPTIFAALSDYSDYQNNPNLLNNDYTTMSNAAPGSKFSGFGGITGSSSSQGVNGGGGGILSRNLMARQFETAMKVAKNTNLQPFFDGKVLASSAETAKFPFPLPKSVNISNSYYIDQYKNNNDNISKANLNSKSNNPLLFNGRLCDTDAPNIIGGKQQNSEKLKFQNVDSLVHGKNSKKKKPSNNHNPISSSSSKKLSANDYFFSSNQDA
jgi:hypothetical protein